MTHEVVVGRLLKVAIIRDPSVPAGTWGPLWLNCPCGANPATRLGGANVYCSCGRVFSSAGFVIESVPGHASACHIHGGLACDRLPGCLQDGV